MRQSRWYCHNCNRQWYSTDNACGAEPWDSSTGCIICKSPHIEYVTYNGRFPGDDYLSKEPLPIENIIPTKPAVEVILTPYVIPSELRVKENPNIAIPNRTLELISAGSNSIEKESEIFDLSDMD
jgi:hypothetical protein